MDFEHFMEIFRARRSNQEPSFWLPDDSELKVLDFCRTLMSILLRSSTSGPINSPTSGIGSRASVAESFVESGKLRRPLFGSSPDEEQELRLCFNPPEKVQQDHSEVRKGSNLAPSNSKLVFETAKLPTIGGKQFFFLIRTKKG